jgi:aminoglycoside phosphotransferase family enzyme/predicted kinase
MNPIEILKGIVGDGKVVETHCSQVLITKNFVYKIKRPVYFGFLDYRELKQRRACSVMEVELNSRFSKNVYLGVYKIVQRQDGYELVELDNTLPALEYVVKMRKIEEKYFLSSIINEKYCDHEYMRATGYYLAEKLVRLERAPDKVDDMDGFELVSFNALENFDQLKEIAPDLLDKRFRFVENATRRVLKEDQELFRIRHRSGYVKNGHGDLRLEHVFVDGVVGEKGGRMTYAEIKRFMAKNRVKITKAVPLDNESCLVLETGRGGGLSMLDCIEFNRRFRTNDVLSEAAFLTMEVDQTEINPFRADNFMHGFFDYLRDNNIDERLDKFKAARITSLKNKDTGEVYFREATNEENFKILNFYKCYRAMVRAKVAILAYLNSSDEELKKAKLAEYNTLMDLAFIYAISMLKNCAIVFCGMLGTGKSTCAEKFAKRFHCAMFGSDEIRKRRFSGGGKPTVVPTGEGIYEENISMEVYKIIGEEAAAAVTTGRLSLINATFLNKKCLQIFENTFEKVPIYVKFTATESTIKERIASRKDGVSDGRIIHFDDLYPLSKEISADFEIDTTPGVLADSLEEVIDKLINLLDT